MWPNFLVVENTIMALSFSALPRQITRLSILGIPKHNMTKIPIAICRINRSFKNMRDDTMMTEVRDASLLLGIEGRGNIVVVVDVLFRYRYLLL